MSILDNEDILLDDDQTIRIHGWLKFHCMINGTYNINNDNTIDINGSIVIMDKEIIKIPYQFNKVTGNFSCAGCYNLISLEGAPRIIGGDFDYRMCNNLKHFDITYKNNKL